MNIFITGINGFIGSNLAEHLTKQGHVVSGCGRAASYKLNNANINYISISDLLKCNDQSLFTNIHTIIHCAALVHQMDNSASYADFEQANTKVTEHLVNIANKAGVTRFIFLSTIKVNGESSGASTAFCESSQPNPQDFYAKSKYLAEQSLQQNFSGKDGWVILRLPLVYGPGVKGNFQSLLSLASSAMPLPFAGISNQRSLLSIFNLCDFVELCLAKPEAKDQLFLLSDPKSVSTTEIMTAIKQASKIQGKLFKLPGLLWKILHKTPGLSNKVSKLVGSLEVDSSKARNLLNWHPKHTLQETLNAMCAKEY